MEHHDTDPSLPPADDALAEPKATPAVEEAFRSTAPPVPGAAPSTLETRALTPSRIQGGAWRSVLLFVTVFLLVSLVLVFTVPLLITRLYVLNGHAEAEVIYAKRRAELRAEADEAERLLDVLDKRINLVSLGFRAVVQKVTPSVVNISSLSDKAPTKNPHHPPLSPNYHDPETNLEYWTVGTGSGVIVKPGYVLTNHHVIRGAVRLRVTFASGQSIAFDVRGHVFSDQPMDLAVLRLPPEPPARFRPDYDVTTAFADSDREVERGDLVLAVGSPLGLKQTVTHGIISARGRLLEKITRAELLQTDAAINPGSSGGALFNQYGKLVGINVAIASDNGMNQGIAFAIPSNTARAVFERLAKEQPKPYGFIGVILSELSRTEAKTLGLTKRNIGGVRIKTVMPGHPAKRAGLEAGDIIIGFENELLDPDVPQRQLIQWIMEHAPPQQVTLEIMRGEQKKRIVVKIGERPSDLP